MAGSTNRVIFEAQLIGSAFVPSLSSLILARVQFGFEKVEPSAQRVEQYC
jgi:hypothetical protein